jgi:hypothetical protein
MTRRASWLLVLLLFGVFAGTVGYVLWQRARAGKGFPEYSVYSEDADGLAESARFLRNLGWEPVAVTRPVQHTRYRGLLVLAEPERSALLPGETPDIPEGDVKALLRWVEQGNTLLYCSRHRTRLHDELGLGVVTDEEAGPEDKVLADVGDAGLYTEEVRRVAVEGRGSLDGPGLPLWWVEGRPGAVLLRRGKGRVLVTADPSPLTHRGLRREDNAVFVYNVALKDARDGKVYFDEYHHGLRSGGGFWGYLAYHGAGWVLAPAALLVAVGVWAVAVRLGPAVPTPKPARADAVDYASAVARIYERAGVRRLPARALVRGFLAALTRHLHLRRNALPAEVLAAWRQQHPAESAERLQALLRGVSQLRKGDVTEPQLLAWTQAFDAFVSSFSGAPRGAGRKVRRRTAPRRKSR